MIKTIDAMKKSLYIHEREIKDVDNVELGERRIKFWTENYHTNTKIEEFYKINKEISNIEKDDLFKLSTHETIQENILLNREEWFQYIDELLSDKYDHVKLPNPFEIPNIIFCDIHLPDSNAFTLMQQIKVQYPSIGIVFITGYTEFAHKAFDLEAIDYLIKPFDQDRFHSCMKKVYAYLNINKISRQNPISDILPIKSNKGIELVDQKNIVYIRAEGKVSKLIVLNGKNKVIQIPESLKSLEARVNSNLFIRTHRSFIVNLNHINRIESSGQTNLIFFKSCSDIAYLSKNYMLAMYQKLNFK